ncbi:very short patch repair endonuclease [Hydrogenophaga defluvii]|uniref:Very short patch repair endonuclease n=2 Tax=Hydrogenophaga defluvii TaxID=249410 RepID=A0ABW2SBG0_9BURK
MADVHSPDIRSKNMRAIRSKNTKPEILVRRALHAAGFRYRLHVLGMPGKPDIVFSKFHAAILIHGCFWHGHDCKFFKLPSTRTEFWRAKIEKNRINDARAFEALVSSGWRVAVVWECEICRRPNEDQLSLTLRLSDWLKSARTSIEIPPAHVSSQ